MYRITMQGRRLLYMTFADQRTATDPALRDEGQNNSTDFTTGGRVLLLCAVMVPIGVLAEMAARALPWLIAVIAKAAWIAIFYRVGAGWGEQIDVDPRSGVLALSE
jgi:hypothetical protein